MHRKSKSENLLRLQILSMREIIDFTSSPQLALRFFENVQQNIADPSHFSDLKQRVSKYFGLVLTF